MSLSDSSFARLRSQMERAEIVPFTGPGFSMGAKDRQGEPVPSSTQLKEELWALSYPDRPLDNTSTIGELFDVARRRCYSALGYYMQSREGTAESFASDVLGRLDDAGKRGFVALGDYSRSLGRTSLALARDLAAERPTLDTLYLSGEEPHWSDLIPAWRREAGISRRRFGAGQERLRISSVESAASRITSGN